MFKADITINRKNYFECSMFYIRKYLSARELILLGVLFAAALLFWISFENMIIFIMFAVVLLIMGFAVMLFVLTALAGYKTDFIKYNITRQLLIFNEWGFSVDSINDKDEKVFSEKIEYKNVDKIALRKDRVYIYGGVALPFYIFPSSIVEGDYEELRLFLISHLDKSKFKMKAKLRYFPFYSKRKFDQDMQEKLNKMDNGDDNDKNKPIV